VIDIGAAASRHTLALLALAGAWVAAVAGLAVLPVSASAVALAWSGRASPRAALVLAWLAGTTALAALACAGLSALVARGLGRHGAHAPWTLLRAPASADDPDEDIDDHR
jgi:hypothetical protein